MLVGDRAREAKRFPGTYAIVVALCIVWPDGY